jgi:molybdopterin adenylyltransferase
MSESPTHRQHERAASQIVARVAVLTLSDTRTPDTDVSGQTLRRLIEQAGHVVQAYALIPDDPTQLREQLSAWLTDATVDAILTNGGTGLAQRDNTIDVVASLIQTPLPGFGELFRMLSYQQVGAAAMLSRATAGIAKGKLLAALPGSPAAVELAARQLLLPQLRHVLSQLAPVQPK